MLLATYLVYKLNCFCGIFTIGGALVSTGYHEVKFACLGWSLGPVKKRPHLIAESNDFAPALAA